MSDSSNSNKYYVPTPIAADYESANNDVIKRAVKFSSTSHRLLSAKGSKANSLDRGATNFRFLEDSLFSNKDAKLNKNSAPSMFDDDYIQKMKELDGVEYKVLRFDRSHNIRSFDFIITYTQLNSFGAEVYKPVLLHKQFKGSLLFTGCSIVRDTDTMEELPLKVYGKYESIGDTVNNSLDLDANENAKGGPTIKVKYTFDKDYVYLFITAVSPFRLIPVGDGEFIDISYAEGKGTLTGETKDNIKIPANPFVGSRKTVSFSTDNRIWCDVVLSLKDTTISHDVNNAEFVEWDAEKMEVAATKLREQEIVFAPTNDGEQIVIGMEPSSTVNLEIAPDMKPIRFGSDLLNTSKEKISNYIEKLKQRIVDCATNVEKVPFSIKTSIRTKGKYNINGDYFIDSQADSFGTIIINDVGVYDSITGKFDITEYIFDKEQTKYSKLSKAKEYKEYSNNVSDYLTKISAADEVTGEKPVYKNVRKTEDLLDVLKNIDFEIPNELDVYFNVAFIKNPFGFNVLAAFAEFGDDASENYDDFIVYVCSDNKIRVVNFKDYNMENIRTVDLTAHITGFTNNNKITRIDRADVDGENKYYIGTDNGLIGIVSNIAGEDIGVVTVGAFDENAKSTESVSLVSTDNLYVYIGGANGNTSVINTRTNAVRYLPSNFRYNDEIVAAKIIDEDTVVFISDHEICSYNMSSNKWNYEGDPYRTGVTFDNPYSNLPKPNVDYIIDKNGWLDVPVVQKNGYVYALGMRYDRESGYTPVYKKLNVFTGKVVDLKLPKANARVYKARLVDDGRYIYSVGGTCVASINDALETRTATYISVFDTITETWLEGDNTVVIGDGVILDAADNYFPVAHEGSIYIVHPKTSVISLNPNTEMYVINTQRVYESYKFTVAVANDQVTLSFEKMPAAFNERFVNIDINIVPVIHHNGEIQFFSGHPDTTNNEFNGYYLEKYVFTPATGDVVLKNLKVGTEYELVHNYDEGRFSNAPADLFGNISVYSEKYECIILLLERYVLYAYSAGENVFYSEIHGIYHNIGDSTKYSHIPLITSGDYSAWRKYNKNKPSNVSMFHIDNYIFFVGGATNRVADVMSLDSMSLIPAPRFYERLHGTPESAVLGNMKDVLNVVPIDDAWTYDELSSVLVNNEMYLLAINTGVNHRAVLMKYELDNVSAKPVIVDDLTSKLWTDTAEELVDWTKVVMTYVPGTNYIVLSTNNGINNGTAVEGSTFVATAYNFVTREARRIIEFGSLLSSQLGTGLIFPHCVSNDNEHSLTFFGNTASIKVTFLGNIINTEYRTTTLEGAQSSLNICKVVKAVNCGIDTYFAYNDGTSVVVKKTNGSVLEDVATIPGSANYAYPDIFARNNEIFVTKGINGADIGIDIFKIDAAGNMTHALLNTPSCAIIAPIAVSKKNNLYVFGIGRTSNSILRVLQSQIKDNTFINYNTIIDINSSEKSEVNRYKPNFTTKTINGHELVFVLGGTQSLAVPTTETIDVFDVNRHIWSQPISLPTKLSHISMIENEIFGATEEITANASQVAYAKHLVINCINYETMNFEIVEGAYPNIDNLTYPVFAKYALDKENNILYVIDIEQDGRIKSGENERSIYRIDITAGTFSKITELPELVYTENAKVIGAFIHDGALVIAAYSEAAGAISVYSYRSNSWLELKRVNLSDIDITQTVVTGLSVFNSTFNAIKNDTAWADSTKAILSIVAGKTVYGIYISCRTSGIVVSNPAKIIELPNAETIDAIYTNTEGFNYASDCEANKIYRCYPNNDEIGFGIKNILAMDSTPVVDRVIIGDKFVSLLDDGSISVLTDVGVKRTHNPNVAVGNVVFGALEVTNSQDVDGFFVNDNDEIVRVHYGVSANEATWTIGNYNFNSLVSGVVKVVDVAAVGGTVYGCFVENTAEQSIIHLFGNDDTERTVELRKVYEGLHPLAFSQAGHVLSMAKDTEGFVVLLKDDEVVDRIGLPKYYSQLVWYYKDSNAYAIDTRGKVLELAVDTVNEKFAYCEFIAKTDIISITSSKKLVFGVDRIYDIDRGISFAIAASIDNEHYSFSDTAINYNNEKIVTIITVPNGDKQICVHDFKTHKLLNKHTISDALTIPQDARHSFVCKTNNVLKYCSVFEGSIQIIDAATGSVTTVADNKLTGEKHILFVPNKNVYIIDTTTSGYVYYDPKTSEITTVDIDLNNYVGFSVSNVLEANKYQHIMYALLNKDDHTYLGKIVDGKLLYVADTKFAHPISDIKDSNLGYVATVGTKTCIFTIDTLKDSITVKSAAHFIDYTNKCVDNKAIVGLKATYHKMVGYVAKNGYVVSPAFTDGMTDVKYREFNEYVLIVGRANDATEITFINTLTGENINFSTDVELSQNFQFANMTATHDDVIDGGITRLGHFVDVIDGEVRSFSIKAGDVENKVNSIETLSEATSIDLVSNYDTGVRLTVTGPYAIVPIQNRYIGVITDGKVYCYTLSSAWRLVVTEASLGLTNDITSSAFVTLCVSDYIYLINKMQNRAVVLCVPNEGMLYNVIDGENVKEIELSEDFLSNLPSTGVFIGENDRVCKADSGNIGVYFNTVKNCSEFYSRYIGVSPNGEIHDAEVPISEYGISYITVSDETNLTTLRSDENIKTKISLIHKSANKNLVSEINAIARLDTAKFSIQYIKTNDDEIGNVYAFTKIESNGILVRDDASYYRGDYAVAIIDNKIVKINVDDTIYTYLKADNEIPLPSEILPLVITYDEREGADGNVEARYLSFVDVDGNLVTYDKELKTFIDISGFVDVEIPFFSTEAMVYPSKSNLMTAAKASIEKTIKATE